MPTAPLNTKCAQLGCKAPRSKLSAYCIEHGGKDTQGIEKTEQRKAFDSMYQTGFWKLTRKLCLSRQPLCQCCLQRGIITEAKHVDHLFPWARIGRQAFFRNIFQCLCQDCHAHKTQLEQRGIVRHYEGDSPTDYNLIDYMAVVPPLSAAP